MSARIRRRGWRDMLARRDGAAAVEFALVSIPLFWMIFGLLEFGVMSMVQTSLDNAVAQTGREIRTGAAQNAGLTKTDIENKICGRVRAIMALTCAGNLFLDVDRYNSFAAVGNGSPLSNGQVDQGQLNYTPGGPDEIILVRAYYQWQVFTPFFGTIFANMVGGRRLIVSSMLFRNEPF